MKLGILGLGFVGGAVEKYFAKQKFVHFKYDKFKKIGSISEINKAQAVFVCVPTPYLPREGFDLSYVLDAIRILQKPKIIVIKSSVVPGTTDGLQTKFPKHKFLFNPEFLREATAYEDFILPDRQIIGYTKKSRSVAKKILSILPGASYKKTMPCLEAETVKYMANAFLALRVVFANEFYDICRALGADYKLVSEAVGHDFRIGHSHFDVGHGGYRGYGGSCFPKDVNSIIQLAMSKKVKPSLLKAMREINLGYLKRSGLTEEFFLSDKHKKKP